MLFNVGRSQSLSGLRKSSTFILLALLSILIASHTDTLAQSASTGMGNGNCPAPDTILITEYPIPSPNREPWGIASGSDGALWFSSAAGNIMSITTDGVFTEHPFPDMHNSQYFFAAGSDGAMWFNDDWQNMIGRITPDGTITEYPLPTGIEDTDDDGVAYTTSLPRGLVTGADDAIWFTEAYMNNIGRLTTDGTLTEYPIPTANSRPVGIALGSDGAVWFTENAANQIGRITTDGEITEYPVPTPGSFLLRITAGPDGALWFTEYRGNKIGRITTEGEITEYVLPAGAGPVGITSGLDTTIWFTEFDANKIGCITTEGEITEYEIPTPNSVPFSIVIGADGAVWFTENAGGKIGRLQVSTSPAATAQTVFSSERFVLLTSVSFGSDWHITDDFTDLFTVKHNQEGWEVGFNIVTHAEVADPVSGDRMPFPEEFSSWIQSNPDFQTNQPIEVVVGGVQGLQIDAMPVVTTRKAFLYLSGIRWNLIPTPERWRFILLNDVNGERLLIMIIAPAAQFEVAVEQAQAVLDTVVFTQ